jgi:hypothetical protein
MALELARKTGDARGSQIEGSRIIPFDSIQFKTLAATLNILQISA